MTDLPSLITRLREADGPSIVLDSKIRKLLDVPIMNYTGSLDAAVALAERVLPGWCWVMSSDAGAAIAPPEKSEYLGDELSYEGAYTGKTTALSLIIAILTAWGERQG